MLTRKQAVYSNVGSNVVLKKSLQRCTVGLCLFLYLLLSACTFGLTQDDCLAINPNQKGMMDGQKGRVYAFNSLAKQCARYEVYFDEQAYHEGWQQGVQSYCQPSTTYLLGRQGKAFPSQCSAAKLPNLLRNEYNRGYDIFQRITALKAHIADIDIQLHESERLRNEIANADDRIEDLQRELKHAIKIDNKHEKDRIKQEMTRLHHNRKDLQAELKESRLSSIARARLRNQRAKLSHTLATLEAQ